MSTNAPTVASDNSLTFSNTGLAAGYSSTNIGLVISSESLVQPNGNLTVVAILKLTQTAGATAPDIINVQTAFVNVMLFTKVNGLPKVLELRRTRDELFTLQTMAQNDPKADQVIRNAAGQVTNIRFRFDNVLLPGVDGLFPNEVIGLNAYEQNSGQTDVLKQGLNFSVAYQSAVDQGIKITIAQNPGKPVVTIVGQSLTPIGGSALLGVSAALKISFPANNGGSPLKYVNAYMMVESSGFNRVVAQILNRPILPNDIINGFMEIESGSNATVGSATQNLFYNSTIDGDTVYFAASVDNEAFQESGLSDLVSFVATVRSPQPTITNFISAEILIPTQNDYSGSNDRPGVKFAFKADLKSTNWNYVSVWAKQVPAAGGTVDKWRMSQMWPRNGDVTNQLLTNGFCKKVWNQKSISINATLNTDATLGLPLPCMSAFDMYVVLSFNPDISTVVAGGALTNDGTSTGQVTIALATQSLPSNVVRVITSLYRPQNQIITTLSNLNAASSGTPTVLTLNNTFFTSSNTMPSSHLAPYFSDTAVVQAPNLRIMLKAVDFALQNKLVYDGSVTPVTFNSRMQVLTGGNVPLDNSFVLDTNPSQWAPNYEFSFKNFLLLPLNAIVQNVITNTPATNLNQNLVYLSYASGGVITKYVLYFDFSSLIPVRSRPTPSTINYLPKVYIDSVSESRLVSGAGQNPTYGSLQLAALLKSVQTYTTFPYSWNQLEIQTDSVPGFGGAGSTIITNTLTGTALLAEILYLAFNFSLDNRVIAPQTGLVTGTIFAGFTPATTVYLRIRLRYMWSGSVPNAASILPVLPDDQVYLGPWLGTDGEINSYFTKPLGASMPVPPPNGVTFARSRALKLIGQITAPESSILLVPGQPLSKVTYYSTRFQLVNGLNENINFPGSYVEVLVGPTGSTFGAAIAAAFLIPSNMLDKVYNVSVTNVYYRTSITDLIVSAPVRSVDIFFEQFPNFTNLTFSETSTNITCIAQLDLGANDNVTVNTTNSFNTSGLSITNNIYDNASLFITCLIPAIDSVTGLETFSHRMKFVPGENVYKTDSLLKISNPETYLSGTKSFLVLANNNTGIGIALFPKSASANTAGSWNINNISNSS